MIHLPMNAELSSLDLSVEGLIWDTLSVHIYLFLQLSVLAKVIKIDTILIQVVFAVWNGPISFISFKI